MEPLEEGNWSRHQTLVKRSFPDRVVGGGRRAIYEF